jgi:hypothetical protein
MRIGRKPKKNKIAFDVLNAKELMQKLLSDRGQWEKGTRN